MFYQRWIAFIFKDNNMILHDNFQTKAADKNITVILFNP